MRRHIRQFLASAYNALRPRLSRRELEQQVTIRELSDKLTETAVQQQSWRAKFVERTHELAEARQMAGSGPWLTEGYRESLDKPGKLRESQASTAAMADLELALESIEWRREINFAWLEFTRWGIQQIILLSRLYFVKNPLIQRGINVAAHYVFGRGVEVSSPDETANGVLKEFFEANKTVLGHIGLTDLERRKYYDGNLFFCFFPDKVSTGIVTIRTIDATEIQDIVTDPEDTDTPWFYRRCWTARVFDPSTGQTATQRMESWYPALGYEPTAKVPSINGIEVEWEHPVLHRRCGSVSKWLFGCPLVYAALDWAREARKFLEACATVKQALAQIAIVLTTKGGQQAIEGAKQQLQTSTGPPSGLWDTNPTAVNASVFASGPGTTLEAFNTKGAGGDPEEVRRYILMVCAVFGFPETFFGDVKTGNLATAQSLDRPTELNFLEKQEAWREDLLTIAMYVLRISAAATSGKLREAYEKGVTIRASQVIRETNRIIMREAKELTAGVVEVSVNFPAILEGDAPALIAAIVAADGTGKIDDKATALALYEQIPGIDNGIELAEEQYPGTAAQRQKKKEDAAAAAIAPSIKPAEAAAKRLARRLIADVAQENGHADHVRS